MSGSAEFSLCGRYRYLLRRTWDPERAGVLFVMLNPSTADATNDDATIRRCVGFARDWGYGGISVANMFAFRATDPRELLSARMRGIDTIGPSNDATLLLAGLDASVIVVAWGNHAGALPYRAEAVISLLRKVARAGDLYCLGLTEQGHPRHPLRLARTTRLQVFP